MASQSDTQAAELVIHASDYWADTGYRVEKGHRYQISIVDMSTIMDSKIPVHDLNGWPWYWPWTLCHIVFAPIFWTRRSPFNPWFSVIATVARRHPRRLCLDQDYIAPATGTLVCYFNDFPLAYKNNIGTAKLKITPR